MGAAQNEELLDWAPSPAPPQATDPGLVSALERLPPAAAAFAYGSGVFLQPGLYQSAGSGAAPMLDFILAVDDPLSWHTQNLALNPTHYSCFATLGPGAVSWAADSIGAGVYFNTLVPMDNRLIKYGVVSCAALLRDLTTWDALYCAGRLHKPVAWLPGGSPPSKLAAAAAANLSAAVRVAGLLLPRRFRDGELLRTLCALSYAGDVRMGWAEDGAKLDRIVQGQGRELRSLYAPALAAAVSEGTLERDPSRPDGWATPPLDAAGATAALAALPTALAARLGAALGAEGPDALARAFQSEPARGARVLRGTLAATVRASSARQTALGLLSAGLFKSGRYGLAKLGKAWRSRQ